MGELLDRLLFLQRYGNSLTDEVRALIAALFSGVERDLRRTDPTSVLPRYRQGRLDALVLRVRARVRDWWPELYATVKDELALLGRQQGVAAYDRLVTTLGTFDVDDQVVRTPVTQARMRAILNTDAFQGRTLRDHSRRLGANIVDKIGVQVRLGMAQEEPINDIVRRVIGKRTMGGRGRVGGVMKTTWRNAEALVRTAVAFTANRGQLETFRENADVLEGVRYTATLDDRTTDICLALDGTEWALDDDGIIVPGEATHYGCRSVLVPLIAWERLGLPRPPTPDRIVRDLSTVTDHELDLAISTRRGRSALGDVKRISSAQTAEAWFRRQRVGVQNRMVGRGRAELFRQGEITLKDLITRDLRSVPLEALRN